MALSNRTVPTFVMFHDVTYKKPTAVPLMCAMTFSNPVKYEVSI